VELCKHHQIQLVAYSSLGVGALLQHATVVDVAARCSKTAAQVLLRWSLQKGACVIPKASSAERIEENHNVFDFELSRDEMAELDDIAAEYPSPQHFAWNPEEVIC
jgi:diketogulonate reductase-like aldo/keto reductase